MHHGLAKRRRVVGGRRPRGDLELELVLVLVLVWLAAGVVHGVDLRHAAGQVSQEPRPHVGVDALGGGQEAGDLVHALAEARAVLPEDGGIGVQSSCWK